MIQLYQGVDIVEIPKFKKISLSHTGFISDIFTDQERDYCLAGKDPYIHFAGRFAAKEASLKALGVGLSGIDHIFQEIEIVRGDSGKPALAFRGWAAKIINRRGIKQATVSISHSSHYAVATVILVGKQILNNS